jgi:hypothetical protein
MPAICELVLTILGQILRAENYDGTGGSYQDEAYSMAYQSLEERWQPDSCIKWIAIGANIFDMRPMSNSESTLTIAPFRDIEV